LYQRLVLLEQMVGEGHPEAFLDEVKKLLLKKVNVLGG
jgi:hypothetical protein